MFVIAARLSADLAPRSRLLLIAVVLYAAPLQAAQWYGPLDVNGDLGYSLRWLKGESSGDATSNQMRGSIHARTWLWQPWLANLNLGLRGTWDESETRRSGAKSGNTSNILTGDLNLGVLQQSRAPFQLVFRASDSRVETLSDDNPLTGLGSREFKTQRLALTQRYFTESGQRYKASFDSHHWQATEQEYDDWKLGAEASIRLPQQTLQARGSVQESEYSQLQQNTQTTLFNVDHFYYPDRALRVDSMASWYDYQRSSVQPLNSTNRADSETDLAQLSSMVFWRPENQPLTVSGGVRFHNLENVATSHESGVQYSANSTQLTVQDMSATAGAIYQWTKNFRFDAHVDYSSSEHDGEQLQTYRGRGNILYQSDIIELFSDVTWQMYGSIGGGLRDVSGATTGTEEVTAGHDIQKLWLPASGLSWRLSLSQSGIANRQVTGVSDTKIGRLNHAASLSQDLQNQHGNMLIQLGLTDTRQYGGQAYNQQMANIQLNLSLNIDRQSSMSGNLTMQKVYKDFNGQLNNDTVTSATGQINYRHSRILGVPRLGFSSDFRVSRATSETGIDRMEWENRLDYAIGLLETRFSWRRSWLGGNMIDGMLATVRDGEVLTSWNDVDNEVIDLVYFQVTRRF